MLNLWVPFIFNRIKIIHVSNDFRFIDVRLKLSFWNRNPGKAIWGGAIFSAADSFYPIMLKQNALLNGIKTENKITAVFTINILNASTKSILRLKS